MFIALRTMDAARAADAEAGGRARAARCAARCGTCARTPELLIPLLMMALVGTISFNFQVLLPLLADFTWHGTATTYALLTAAMGVGSVAGALAAGARGRVSPRPARRVVAGSSASRCCWPPRRRRWSCRSSALIPLGAASVTFAAGVNSTLQIAVEPVMRGRVMALYSVVFLGSTPIGAPLVGWLAEVAGPRAGLVAGAVAALVAALVATLAFRRAGLLESTLDPVSNTRSNRVEAPRPLVTQSRPSRKTHAARPDHRTPALRPAGGAQRARAGSRSAGE